MQTNAQQTADYFPFGLEKPTTTTQDRQKFGTYLRDSETGLDYADQRYFSSTAGRFMTADPYQASGGAGDPGSWNRYAYVGGDPVNYRDPRGLEKQPTYCDIYDDPICKEFGNVSPGASPGPQITYCSTTGKYVSDDSQCPEDPYCPADLLCKPTDTAHGGILRNELQSALNNLSENCKKQLGSRWNLADLQYKTSASNENGVHFHDTTEPTIFLPHTMGYWDPTLTGFASVLPDSSYTGYFAPAFTSAYRNTIVVGARFARLSGEERARVLVHELLHAYAGLQGDSALAIALGLGSFDNLNAAVAIGNYFRDDCNGPKQ